MIGMQSGSFAAQSGLEGVFTSQFGLLWLVALLAGIGFALIVHQVRKHEFISADPGDSAWLVVAGVSMTGFIAGFWVGWNAVVFLMLFFVATGLPQIVECQMARLDARKAALRRQMTHGE